MADKRKYKVVLMRGSGEVLGDWEFDEDYTVSEFDPDDIADLILEDEERDRFPKAEPIR